MGLFQLKRSIGRSDYRFIGPIILYVIYNFIRNSILSPINSTDLSAEDNALPVLYILDIIQWLLVFSIVILNIGKDTHGISDWGLPYKRELWIAVAVIIFAIVYSTRFIIHYSAGEIWNAIHITLNITCNELVVRAALIGYLINLFGKNKRGIILAILISSIFYTIIVAPIAPSIHSFGSELIFGCVYYFTGSILINMFFLSVYYGSNELITYIGISVIAIYFILMIATRYFGARREKICPASQGDL